MNDITTHPVTQLALPFLSYPPHVAFQHHIQLVSGIWVLPSTSTAAIPGPLSSHPWEPIASLLPLWLPYGPALKPVGVTLNIHLSEPVSSLLTALQWSESSPYSLPRTMRRPDLTPPYFFSDHVPSSFSPFMPNFYLCLFPFGGQALPRFLHSWLLLVV